MAQQKTEFFPLKYNQKWGVTLVWLLAGLWLAINLFAAVKNPDKIERVEVHGEFDRKILHRNRRFIYMDSNRSLTLPPKSILAFSFVASLPFLGNLPVGFQSGLTISVPLTIKFDDLNMTSEENRFGYLDFMSLRDLGISSVENARDSQASTGIYETISHLLSKSKRSLRQNQIPGVNYAGGDRELVYNMVESLTSNFGIDGSSCLMRAICEVNEAPVKHQGLFGEILQLLLTPSDAAFAEIRFPAYFEAEKHGRNTGDCRKYEEHCPYTIFGSKLFHSRSEYLPEARTYSSRFIDNNINGSSHKHHLEKRFIYFGPHRNIFLPPSTRFVCTPTLNLPFLRSLPKGYSSQISYSMPFSISFDALGLTSALNLFGQIPFLKRKRRHTTSNQYPGGDREMVYALVVDSLTNTGMNGEACLQRAICEIHEASLRNHGLFGEIMELFLTPSLAPDSQDRLGIFVEAERTGRYCGDCKRYHQDCPNTLFTEAPPKAKERSQVKLNQCSQLSKINSYQTNFLQTYKSKVIKSTRNKNKSSSDSFIEEIANKMNLKRILEMAELE